MAKQVPHVGVCITSGGEWTPEFGISLSKMLCYTMAMHGPASEMPIMALPHFVAGSVIAENRNKLVDIALENGASHILFIDDDQIFPADTLARLVDRDCPIVGANIVRREANPRTNSRVLGQKGCQWTLPSDTGCLEVDYLGTGLIMIKREVFEAMDKPYYFYDVAKGLGEDSEFCIKARAKGYSTYIDHDLSKEVKHAGRFFWGMEHTGPWQLAKQKEALNGNQ